MIPFDNNLARVADLNTDQARRAVVIAQVRQADADQSQPPAFDRRAGRIQELESSPEDRGGVRGSPAIVRERVTRA